MSESKRTLNLEKNVNLSFGMRSCSPLSTFHVDIGRFITGCDNPKDMPTTGAASPKMHGI